MPHWRLIGLDTALMGSNLPEEGEQIEFLQDALAGRGPLQAMVFVHMPPFERDHLSAANPTSYIPVTARAKFLDVCADAGVKVIACGHKHVYRKVRHRGMDIVWAPATAMVDVKHPLARRGTFPRPGYLEWTLGPQQRIACAGRAGTDVRDRHDRLDGAQRRHHDDAAGVALTVIPGRAKREPGIHSPCVRETTDRSLGLMYAAKEK